MGVLSGPGPQTPPVPRPRAGGGRWPHALMLMRRQYDAPVEKDAAGFPVEQQPDETAFRGWLQPVPTREQQQEESGAVVSTHILFAPMSLDARKGDRVRWEPDTGRRYELTADPQDAAGRQHHWEIDLVEYRVEVPA